VHHVPAIRQARVERSQRDRAHVDEGGRSGTTIQILVGTADGELASGAREVHLDGARAVRQIPDHHRARGMGLCGQRRHVVLAPGAVINLRQHDNRHRVIHGVLNLFRRDCAQAIARILQCNQPFGHIEVGREVAGVGQDDTPVRAHLQCRRQRLEHLDRQGVPITTLPGAAPISAPMRSPTRDGWSIQPQAFQPRISCCPHSSRTTRCTASVRPWAGDPASYHQDKARPQAGRTSPCGVGAWWHSGLTTTACLAQPARPCKRRPLSSPAGLPNCNCADRDNTRRLPWDIADAASQRKAIRRLKWLHSTGPAGNG
jgi:hypothetical protein